MKTFRIGVLSTFRDQEALTLFQAMHRACEAGFIQGRISFVFSNRERGEFPETDDYLSEVEQSGIPLLCYSSRRFKPDERRRGRDDPELLERWRVKYDRAGPDPAAREYAPDIIVLSGYMLILGSEMCAKWQMINLHPALPWGPKGSWEEVVWELMRTGQKETGTMMHLVTRDLDRGPPISFYRVSLEDLKPLWDEWKQRLAHEDFERVKKAEYRSNSLFLAIREKQVRGETPLILLTLKYISEGVIEIRREGGERKIYTHGASCPHGMRIDADVESYLNQHA
ncbi:hypothetical protein AMJ40_03735 [candidate division TA06 bacterium DG_26]|uniref:phosphoribosylglycinamide formyltransferase 1 n=1 Tax=candidate division TA06 bacterium DG_26 TaxID=1703771 RepID=A0A0S7WIY5_UNCT6|nr:MAG: hypothetical protein AMJ40_03735 [candidate division TA06 bacterium DG_26]